MIDAQTAAELRRELAPAMRGGKITADELVDYLFSNQAAEGLSAPLHESAIRMAEFWIKNKSIKTPKSNGEVIIKRYAMQSAMSEAVDICVALEKAGVLAGETPAVFGVALLNTAAARRPMDRVADRFGF